MRRWPAAAAVATWMMKDVVFEFGVRNPDITERWTRQCINDPYTPSHDLHFPDRPTYDVLCNYII